MTTLISALVAYDPASALRRLLLILLGVALVIGALAVPTGHHRQVLTATSVMAAVLASGVSVSVLMGSPLHANAAAGALVVLMPLGAAAGVAAVRAKQFLAALLLGLALAVSTAALIVTGSRGAWFGLAVGSAAAGYLWWRSGTRVPPTLRTVADLVIGGLVLAGLVLFVALIASPALDARLGLATLGGSAASRLQLWRDTLPLLQDYALTGSGLGSTAMVYSSYALLLHVPYYYHAHNLYLQVALEQGLLGLAALLGLAGWAGRRLLERRPHSTRHGRIYRSAALAALAALLVHGLVDAELYGSALAPLAFVPVAFAVLAQTAGRPAPVPTYTATDARVGRIVLGSVIGAALVMVVLQTLPAARAAVLANGGAVLQTRRELSAQQRVGGLQDELRRGAVDLVAPMALYAQALALDPANLTALRRLGQIALSQGRYAEAVQVLQLAHQAAPNQALIGQLLGEAYAVSGRVDDAAAVWRQFPLNDSQLATRRWWYDHIGATEQVEWVDQAQTRAAP